MRYIALLRGINVGGKNKVAMPQLKNCFEAHGFTQVATYINSGNVLFSSPEGDLALLKERCEALIQAGFGLDIPVAVIPAHILEEALGQAPPWWNNGQEAKHNAIFVIPPATAEEVCALVGEIKPEYEQVAVYGPVIFWTAPIKTFSRSRWSKVVGTAAYNSITIRNANTTVKLAAWASEAEA